MTALLGNGISNLAIKRRHFTFRHPSPDHWLAHFRRHFGPAERASAGLDQDGQEAFAADLLGVITRFNRASDGTLVAPAEYLEVVATRR